MEEAGTSWLPAPNFVGCHCRRASKRRTPKPFQGLVKTVPTGIPALYMSLQKLSAQARHDAWRSKTTCTMLRDFTRHVIGKDA